MADQLHIPYKEWRQGSLSPYDNGRMELENYLEIERWANRNVSGGGAVEPFVDGMVDGALGGDSPATRAWTTFNAAVSFFVSAGFTAITLGMKNDPIETASTSISSFNKVVVFGLGGVTWNLNGFAITGGAIDIYDVIASLSANNQFPTNTRAFDCGFAYGGSVASPITVTDGGGGSGAESLLGALFAGCVFRRVAPSGRHYDCIFFLQGTRGGGSGADYSVTWPISAYLQNCEIEMGNVGAGAPSANVTINATSSIFYAQDVYLTYVVTIF